MTMTTLQRIRYIWLRFGLTMLVVMPLAMFLTFRPWHVDSLIFVSDSVTTVDETDDAIAFVPAAPTGAGLLLIPGCPVDPRAYAPLARAIADTGHIAAIVQVPLRCAPGAAQEAELDARVARLVRRWSPTPFVLAGHSRGAAHTARIALSGVAPLRGYVLMGTSHPRERDLSGLTVPVTKIAGTRDGVAGEAQFDGRLLPAATAWVRIEGGNHSQFGYYAFQLFDHTATITREEQQRQIHQALLQALAR